MTVLFLTVLVLTGCKNIFVDNILKKPDISPGGKTGYTVSIDPLEHGAIAARPPSGPAGSEIILMVSPEPGYRLQQGSLKYRGNGGEAAVDDGTRAFRLPAHDVTVSAVFESLPRDNFSISVKIDGLEHGIIVARPEFGYLDTPVYLAVIPDPGYRYQSGSLKYNNTPVDDLSRTFLLPDKHVLVTAKFEALPSAADYTVRAGATQNGRIFARPEFSPEGAEVYLQVSPDPGYILKKNSLKYTSTAGETMINERDRAFIMPAAHVTAAAEFIPVPGLDDYTVSSDNILNGRIIPVPGYGKEKTAVYLQVIPDPGHALVPGSLKIKGPSVDRQVNEKTQIFEMPPEHVTAGAKFKVLPPGQYTVRADVFDHGRILAVPAYGGEGTVISLQLYPDVGYRLKTGTLRYLTGSGQSAPIDEAARNFSLPADYVTIRAEFEELPKGNYMVFSDATANGHIIPAPEFGPKDKEIFLWVIPDAGYQYKPGTLSFRTDKTAPPAYIPDSARTFHLPESHVLVSAEFESVPDGKYTVRITPAARGRISVNPDAAAAGETVTLTIKPDPEHRLKKGSLKYAGDDGVVTPISETFIMPGKHITVRGEFEEIQYEVNIDKKLSGGQIGVKPERAYPGETITLTVKPDNGNRYTAKSLKYLDTGGGEKFVDEKTLQFIMPRDDVTVTANFTPFTAMRNLKINNRTLVNLADGKTDYTVWFLNQVTEAVFTFDALAANAEAKPKSGTKHTLQPLENVIKYTVKDPDGITNTTYTFRVIRELVPFKDVPPGKFFLEKKKTMEITKPFRIGTYELTQGEWKRVMGYDRGGNEGEDFPVHRISWYEAVIFCNKLSMLEQKTPVYSMNSQTDPGVWGKAPSSIKEPAWFIDANWSANGYRLPTEMEWLWAAMGAANGQGGTNSTIAGKLAYAGSQIIKTANEAAWYRVTANNRCHQKGTKKPNQLGLYDMSGNAGEWCWDKYNNTIMGDRDYTGATVGSQRVIRGGYYLAEHSALSLGFRGNSSLNPNTVPHEAPLWSGMRILCRD
ncbi:MAG: SUMF1/EgtB/PvdO family nonheme iron enzyme [Treponema sp.]|nr:SUMF1/EgtB/PvdO family nonheme iron enzyme [Treponema sp.]